MCSIQQDSGENVHKKLRALADEPEPISDLELIDSDPKEQIMSKNLIANATTSIEATKSKVWQALVAPDAIKQYMFGADVESDWSEGSAIT
jgi:hypothetical protein